MSIKLLIDPVVVKTSSIIKVKGLFSTDIKNYAGEEYDFNLTVTFQSKVVFYSGPIRVSGKPSRRGSKVVYKYCWNIPVPINEGKYEVFFDVYNSSGEEIDKEYGFFYVANPDKRPPLRVILVWHNHQAPNILPNGKYYADWGMRHVWCNELKPLYWGGPYFIHALMLLKYPKIKTVQHLSPSLLKQWAEVIERGYEVIDGRTYPPESPEASSVKWVLDTFRRIALEGRIELLTSVYAHTILGFLVWKFEMSDIVLEELVLGKGITESVMNVKSRGVWTPEMAFNMKLVDIYSRVGVKYTILCGKIHFESAEGEKSNIYSPYILENPRTGNNIIVFFRDQPISDYIGFNNNYPTSYEADKGAREVLAQLMLRYFLQNKEPYVVTIALDGENWIIFSKYPANAAYFLDRLYYYLTEAQEQGIIETTTLEEALKVSPPKRKLTYVPTTSWLGGFYKWYGEAGEEHFKCWEELLEQYHNIKAYKYMRGVEDKKLKYAKWCLYHALDSDYWWKEYFSPEIIRAWLREIDKTLKPELKKIIVEEVSLSSDVSEKKFSATIKVKNSAEYPVNLKASLIVEPEHSKVEREFTIKPLTTATIELETPFNNSVGGLSVRIIAGPLILYEEFYEVKSGSHLKPSITIGNSVLSSGEN